MTERLRLNDDVVWQDVLDADLVLLHPGSGVYYGLNAAGGCVWRSLAGGPRTTDALVREVISAFPVDPERAAADVARLVASLRAADLITSAPAP